MLSIGLLFVAMAANASYKEGYRVLICFVTVFVAIAHVAFFDEDVSYSYYGSAAIANLVVIQAVSLFSKSPLATDIQVINCVGLAAQLFGFLQYESGYSPEYYNNIMVILITAEFIRLMLRTDRDRIYSICEADRLHSDIHLYDGGSGSTHTGRSK
tara:strand:+ start:284 stop:751 length:468 start_codon:yes stop_codon:yes gene_type:complete